MSDGVSLKAMIQGLIPEQTSIISAKVASVKPLRVVATNNTKLQISSRSLIVPEHLSKHTETFSFSLEDKQYHNVNVVVDNSLKVGDIVYLLFFQQKSKFYVLGRRC